MNLEFVDHYKKLSLFLFLIFILSIYKWINQCDKSIELNVNAFIRTLTISNNIHSINNNWLVNFLKNIAYYTLFIYKFMWEVIKCQVPNI